MLPTPFLPRPTLLPTLFSFCTYGITTNGLLLVSVPLGVVTVTYPVVAPAGTVASMNVSDLTVNDAGVPFSETDVVPVKPWPRMPIGWPTEPEARTKATNGPRSPDTL